MQQALFFSGKRSDQSVIAVTDTDPASQLPQQRLLRVLDPFSSLKYLIDTGAELSLLLKAYSSSTSLLGPSLYADNGSAIATYGEKSLTLDLGLRRSLRWIFTIADVSQPILGADFLSTSG